LALVALAASVEEDSSSVFRLDEDISPAPFNAKTSLLQMEAGAGLKAKLGMKVEMREGADAQSTIAMTDEDRQEFKAHFLSMAAKIHTPQLRSNVMIAEKMASEELDRTNGKVAAGGSGMDLIFNKLEALQQEIKDEQAEDDKWIKGQRAKASQSRNSYLSAIKTSEDKIAANDLASKKDQADINGWRAAWHESRAAEAGTGGTHPMLKKMEATRAQESAIIREQVDERNKALDVLVEALFLVCERFNRYKNTALCMQIKSQPDVEEPDRYETKEPEMAKKETDELHGAGSAFVDLWKNQKIKDAQLEDVMCPETPDDCPMANQSGIKLLQNVRIVAEDKFLFEHKVMSHVGPCAVRCADKSNCKAFTYNRKTMYCDLFTDAGKQVDSEDHQSGVKAAEKKVIAPNAPTPPPPAQSLLQVESRDVVQEKRALARMKNLARMNLPSRYTVPIQEVTMALEEADGADGKPPSTKKKRKTIVQILIAIIEETRQEQISAKAVHQMKLDAWYAQSWQSWASLKSQLDNQARLHSDWRAARARIQDRIADNNLQKASVKANLNEVRSMELELKDDEREYGIQTSLREEDQENIIKLRSLLRALYDKSTPVGCARVGGVICTDKVAGWCVYSERVGREQRCSCNVGFYGVACQLKMCPGNGDVLYKHDQEGVCSNNDKEARGEGQTGGKGCDNTTGKCHCAKDFYHGPMLKCEYRHAPPSKYPSQGANYLEGKGVIDEKCSGHGTVDKITGICTCQADWWGEAPNDIQRGGGCEERKCYGGGGQEVGLKFERPSSNVCNGRGACNPVDGTCSCVAPYFGVMCEKTKCPADCNNGLNGACDTVKGLCSCKQSPIKFSGPSCMYMDCPADCGRPSGGECDRNDGHCICRMGYSGLSCERSSRCAPAALNTKETNWYTLWDKPGWITCPKGQLLYALKRRKCEALSCLDSGSCAAGCEGNSKVYQIRHCYHDLGWYNSMDMAGWSKCQPDYFIAGLYRSCESLYCLQIAKCCSMSEVRWAGNPRPCKEASWAADFKETGKGSLGSDGQHAFITGFYRKRGHDLKSLEKASYCEFVRNY
jgi:hypothetical protein